VAAIAAAGSTAEAFRQGLAPRRGRSWAATWPSASEQRDFTPAEQVAFAGAGRVVYAAGAQAMAQAAGGERRLVELRGVGPGFPLAGQVGLQGARDLDAAFRPDADGVPGVAVEPALLDRLGLRLGQRFTIGNEVFVARAVLTAEPDRIGRFALGPGC